MINQGNQIPIAEHHSVKSYFDNKRNLVHRTILESTMGKAIELGISTVHRVFENVQRKRTGELETRDSLPGQAGVGDKVLKSLTRAST